MNILKTLFYKMFPKYDMRPIAPVYHVDFKNKKLVNKETCTRFIYSEKIVDKKSA